MDTATVVITTLLATPAVLAMVNLYKSLGLKGNWSALAAVLTALAFGAAEAYAPAGIWDWFSRSLIVGLSAAGTYDVAKLVGAALHPAAKPAETV